MTPAELKAMGGQQHPVVGNYGRDVGQERWNDVMITTTIPSFVWT